MVCEVSDPSASSIPSAAPASTRAGTAGGLFALLVWSCSVAVIRGLSESVGTMTGATLAAALGGVVTLGYAWLRGQSPRAMLGLPKRYLLVCGALFVACVISLYAAVGLAPNRSTTLVVGLVNYLWPALTVALSVPLLGRRARWTLAVGCVVAVGGTALALLGQPEFQWGEFRRQGWALALPVALAAVAAGTWGFYCNLVKRWGRPDAGAVPLFVLATAGGMALLRMAFPDAAMHPPGWQPQWSFKACAELGVLALASQAAAYALWDFGMRRGNHVLLSLASYFVPIGSVIVASFYLNVVPGPMLAGGFVLVVAGALICRFSLKDDGPPPDAEPENTAG